MSSCQKAAVPMPEPLGIAQRHEAHGRACLYYEVRACLRALLMRAQLNLGQEAIARENRKKRSKPVYGRECPLSGAVCCDALASKTGSARPIGPTAGRGF